MSLKRPHEPPSSSPPALTPPAQIAPTTELKCWVTLVDYPSTAQPTSIHSVSRTVDGARRTVAAMKQDSQATYSQITDAGHGLGYAINAGVDVLMRVRVVETPLNQ